MSDLLFYQGSNEHISGIGIQVIKLGWPNGHKCYIQAKVYCTCIKSPLWLIIVPNIKIKFKINIAIVTQICHTQMLYFTSMSNAWYMSAVPNMNKIMTFLSQISQSTLKIYNKNTYFAEIWHRDKFNFTCIRGIWCLIMVPQGIKSGFAVGSHWPLRF